LPESLRKSIFTKCHRLLKAEDLRLVPADNLHVTLRFLGDLSPPQLELLFQAVKAAARSRPFLLQLAGIGAFPNRRAPNIIWIGIATGATELQSLWMVLNRSLLEAGFEKPDTQHFTGHLTVARVRAPRRTTTLALRQLLAPSANATPVFGEFGVSHLTAMSSRLTPGGSIYTPLLRQPLSEQ